MLNVTGLNDKKLSWKTCQCSMSLRLYQNVIQPHHNHQQTAPLKYSICLTQGNNKMALVRQKTHGVWDACQISKPAVHTLVL